MSTEGGAAVVVLPIGLLAVPVVVAGAVVVGAGILVYQGAVYCGEKLKENYENACKSWVASQAGAITEARQNVQNPQAMWQAAQAQFRQSQAHLPAERQQELRDPQATAQAEAAMQQAIQQAIAQAQASALTPPQAADSTARASLAARTDDLRGEIAAARKGGLPAAIIQQAEGTLRQAEGAKDAQADHINSVILPAITQAREAFQKAWASVTETEKIRTRNADAARVAIVQVRARLAVAQSLLKPGHTALEGQLNDLAAAIETAGSRIQSDPLRALDEATGAKTRLESLMGSVYKVSVTAGVADAASAAIQGRLKALEDILNDARGVDTFVKDRDKFDELVRRLDTLKQAVARITDASLATLAEETERLKQNVFDFINSRQQKATAQVISETLAQMRFRSQAGAAPEVREVIPGLYQVVGIREDAPAGAGRDDKRVLFTLSDDGKVTYDFSGYVGDACQSDAQAIFAALRAKGIVIADDAWVREQQQHLATLTDAQLSAAPLPTFDVNKRQTELIARVVRALAMMGFAPEKTEVTSAEGVVQIDARSDTLGYYHVAIDPDGDMRTKKNDQNVSGDATDGVAQVAKMADLPQATYAEEEEEETGYFQPGTAQQRQH